MSRLRAPGLLCLTLAACAACARPGRSILAVTLSADPTLAGRIATVELTASQGRELSRQSFAWAGPAPLSVGLYLDRSLSGLVEVSAVALDQGGQPRGRGHGSALVTAGQVSAPASIAISPDTEDTDAGADGRDARAPTDTQARDGAAAERVALDAAAGTDAAADLPPTPGPDAAAPPGPDAAPPGPDAAAPPGPDAAAPPGPDAAAPPPRDAPAMPPLRDGPAMPPPPDAPVDKGTAPADPTIEECFLGLRAGEGTYQVATKASADGKIRMGIALETAGGIGTSGSYAYRPYRLGLETPYGRACLTDEAALKASYTGSHHNCRDLMSVTVSGRRYEIVSPDTSPDRTEATLAIYEGPTLLLSPVKLLTTSCTGSGPAKQCRSGGPCL